MSKRPVRPLTPAERELVQQWKHLPRAVARRLVADHGHNCLARDRLWCSFMDLVKHGYLGLADAAQSYDPTKGATFSTYGWTCIHNAQCDFLEAQNRHGRPLAMMQGLEARLERLMQRHKDLLPEVALLR